MGERLKLIIGDWLEKYQKAIAKSILLTKGLFMLFWKKKKKTDNNKMEDFAIDPLADLFPPVPQEFMKILLEYCDKENPAISVINSKTYLKRLYELGMLDLDGLCDKLNYVFFNGNEVLELNLFGKYNIDEIVEFIKEKSALGSVLETK